MKKKFQLEILDPVGNVVTTHHFFYNQGMHNKIRITIDDKQFFWENNEALEFEPKVVLDNSGSLPEPKYFNKETKKVQKLFCEEVLIPTWTVRYEDPTRGNKGEALYYTISAKHEDEAKTLALANPEFNQHILPEHFEKRYLTAFRATGNYKIGEVQYFEGDPRL